jgi:type IV pilus assembly protein PilF
MKQFALRSVLLLSLSMIMLVAGAASPRDAGGAMDDKRRVADAHLELANAYFSEGRYDIALDEADLALNADGDRTDVLGLRALALMKLDEPQQALSSMQHALKIAPDDPGLQNNMGWILCESGKAMQGLPYFERALANRRYASPANAAMNAGLCSLKIGDKARAEKYFRQALQSERGLLPAQANLARLAFERGDVAQARKQMLPVIASGQASSDDFSIAIRIERKLGDKDAEVSLASQWQRRFPDSPELQAYIRGDLHE